MTTLTLSPLSATMVVLIRFISRLSQLLVRKCVFKHQDLQMFGIKSNIAYMRNKII